MAGLDRTLQDLRQERKRAEGEVERLGEAISVLEGVVGQNHGGRPARRSLSAGRPRGRRRMSAAGRARIAAAQRARWAKVKRSKPVKAKRTMSAAGRNKIAAAQRARWAKLKAKQQKKAA